MKWLRDWYFRIIFATTFILILNPISYSIGGKISIMSGDVIAITYNFLMTFGVVISRDKWGASSFDFILGKLQSV